MQRVLFTCIALRTNLTFRELAALAGTTKSTAHRIVAALVPRLALLASSARHDRRWSWIVDGTMVPTHDHTAAAGAMSGGQGSPGGAVGCGP